MRTLALIFAFLALSGAVLGSDGDGGTESPFALGLGARDLALGGADLTGGRATTAPVWGAARLATEQRMALEGFHCRLYDSDVAYQYLGVVWPSLDLGTIGLGVARLGIDGIEKRDSSNYYLGDISDSRLGIYFAYARTIAGYRAGFTVHLEHHTLDDYSSTSSPGIDLSVHRQFDISQGWLRDISLGLQGRNLVQPATQLDLQQIKHPQAVDIALAISFGAKPDSGHRVQLAGKVTKVSHIESEFAAGVEYTAGRLLAVRLGWRDAHMAAGAGLDLGFATFDYALVDRDMGYLHMFSLGSRFGATTSEKRRRRAERQEAAFNQMMEQRWHDRNHQMTERLLIDGRSALESGNLAQAVQILDRAMFLAKAGGMDTTALAPLAAEARERYDRAVMEQRLTALLDSATEHLNYGHYVRAEHFAQRALDLQPESTTAQRVMDQASAALDALTERDSLIEAQLLAVDSLLAYGRPTEAIRRVDGLIRLAPDNPRAQLAVKRTRFESFMQRAESAFRVRDVSSAATLVDSALALFPDHQESLDLKAQIAKAQQQVDTKVATPVTRPPVRVSEDLRKQVAATYRSGRAHFERGDLPEAIMAWEEVDRLVPDFESVRDYLVSAYKYVGVQYYGENRLEEAISSWRRAADLQPENQEIKAYISRAEGEAQRLRELSYEG